MAETFKNPVADAMAKWQTSLGDVSTEPTGATAAAAVANPGTAIAATGGATAPAPPKVDVAKAAPDKAVEDKAATDKAATAATGSEVDELDDADDTKWPRKAEDWKKFKAKRKEKESALAKQLADEKRERERIAVELETAKKTVAPPDYEDIKKERDQLSEKLRITDVTQHPKFIAYFGGKTKQQLDLAKQIVGADKAADIEKILSLPEGAGRDAAIEDAIAAMTPLQQSRIGNVVNALSQIEQERQAAIADAGNQHQEMTKRETEARTKAQAQRKAEFESAFEATVKAQSGADGNPFLTKIDGNEEHNKEVETRLAYAKGLMFGNNPPQAIAKAALHAAIVPAVIQRNLALQEQVTKLEAQVKSLTAAAPALAGSTPPSGANNGGVTGLKVGMRPDDVSKRWAAATAEALTR